MEKSKAMVAAARTGTLLNYNSLANDAAVDVKTVKLWISILERTGIVKRLESYYINVSKRMVTTPKLYFLDTGLCACLAAYETPEILERGMLSGAIPETYVFSELMKSYWHNGREPFMYFYRDHRKLTLCWSGTACCIPWTRKKQPVPAKPMSGPYKALEKLDKPPGTGAIICLYPDIQPIAGEDILSVPVWEL
jgi:predicted AAA+ superfamily ATPase